MNGLQAFANNVLIHSGSVLGAIFRRDYFAKSRNGKRVSEKALRKLLRVNQNTEYGKRYGFSSINSVEDYQKAVPLSTYDDYREYIKRMVDKGEKNLITARRISFYATTSGTVGETKLIPQIASYFWPSFKLICIMANDLTTAMRMRGVPSATARGLLTTEIHINALHEGKKRRFGDARVGGISSYGTDGMKLFLPLLTTLPKEAFEGGQINDLRYIKARYALQDPDVKWIGGIFMSALSDIISYIESNHEMLIRDIEKGVIDPSVDISEEARGNLEKKLRPAPARAAELREIFARSSDEGAFAKVWKKLSFVCSVGGGEFMPFTKKMRAVCGDDVYFAYAFYGASEALMGFAMHMEDPSYLLLLDGNFYEFLPVEDECESMPERPLLAHELEVGKHYEIIVTNCSGLYRYRIRDVVKITGFEGETPYMEFAYRANRATDLCGAHINDEFVAAATAAVEKELGLRVEDYSLYADTDAEPPRIVMFMEPERPVDAEQRKRMQEVFEAAMVQGGRGYRLAREAGNLAPCAVNTVAPGTYRAYRQMRVAAGASENQLKSIRVIRPGKEYEFFLSGVDAGAGQVGGGR